MYQYQLNIIKPGIRDISMRCESPKPLIIGDSIMVKSVNYKIVKIVGDIVNICNFLWCYIDFNRPWYESRQSGVKGIRWHKAAQKWTVWKEEKYHGIYECKLKAIRALRSIK